jgi:hypothetical protein
VLNTSVSNFSSTTNHTNNLLNFEKIINNNVKKETADKNKIFKKLNKRIDENIFVHNSLSLIKTNTNLTPKVKCGNNEKTRENKFKFDQKNHMISSSVKQSNKKGNGSKNKSLKLRNVSAQNNKSKSITYCPRIYDAKTLKKV